MDLLIVTGSGAALIGLFFAIGWAFDYPRETGPMVRLRKALRWVAQAGGFLIASFMLGLLTVGPILYGII